MILNELSAVPSGVYPIQELSDHLHLGTGFADDGSQSSVLEAYLRAAVAAVEARTGKALFQRRFSWVLYTWISRTRQGLPISPVQLVESIFVHGADGASTTVDPATYTLEQDSQFPAIVSKSASLPHLQKNGYVEIVVEAGYGPAWDDVPKDLGQAVLMLAASYYENRQGTRTGNDDIPFGVLALLEPYRKIRLSGAAR